MGRAFDSASTWFALGALTLLGACGGSGQTSSESHWVTCATNAVCQAIEPTATCVASYCEAPDGTRLVQGAATGGAGAETSGGGASTGGDAPLGEAGDSATLGGAGGSNQAGAGTGGEPTTGCDPLPEPLPSPQVYEGNYLITNAASVAAAQGLTEITGSLTLAARGADEIEDISLPVLEALGGDLAFQSPVAVSFGFPNLREIGGNLELSVNGRLERVDLRQLERVTGSVVVTDNAALERLRLDSLTSVGSFDLTGDALPGCEIDAILSRLSLATGGVGRADCECQTTCGWLEATCL